MTHIPDLVRIATAIGDARRVQMLALLMEGRALTAKELALGAGIEPATASAHLKRLLDDGLVIATSQGRHKYFRLASPQVAQLVESLMLLAPRRAGAAREPVREPIKIARYCYDHLAGELGTGLFSLMLQKKWLRDDDEAAKQLKLTPKGEKSLQAMGVDVQNAWQRRRQFACRCLDWSERKDHLGGALGAALADQLTTLRWIDRQKHTRVVKITPLGTEGLQALGLRAALAA